MSWFKKIKIIPRTKYRIIEDGITYGDAQNYRLQMKPLGDSWKSLGTDIDREELIRIASELAGVEPPEPVVVVWQYPPEEK